MSQVVSRKLNIGLIFASPKAEYRTEPKAWRAPGYFTQTVYKFLIFASPKGELRASRPKDELLSKHRITQHSAIILSGAKTEYRVGPKAPSAPGYLPWRGVHRTRFPSACLILGSSALNSSALKENWSQSCSGLPKDFFNVTPLLLTYTYWSNFCKSEGRVSGCEAENRALPQTPVSCSNFK